MSLGWYVRRLSKMTPAEVHGRLRDAWTKRRWRSRQVRPGETDPLKLCTSNMAPFASGLAAFDRSQVPTAVTERILRTADAALEGRFRFFDREWQNLSAEPDWFLDPRTGIRAPQHDYAFDIDHRNVERSGTVKYVWEPSRHYQLTVLAAAYYLTGDTRYADFAAAQLQSWMRENPFLSGIHWTSGIEIGIRLISWVWIRRLLADWPGVAALFDDNIVFRRQLHHHQEYLARLRSHGSSANNHVIAEEAGQYAACCAFPFFPETQDWRNHAAAVLRREVRLQTFESGLNRELATSYHILVLELLLAVAVEGEASGHPLGSDFWHRICEMTDALAAIIDTHGRPPRQGDGDQGRGLVLDDPDASPAASLLATGAAFFGACDWWPTGAAKADLRTLLWRHLAGRRMPSGVRPSTMPSLFADAGMALLRDKAGTEDEIWCRCDHGPHGFLSIAAHAHADALSIELRCGGVEVLADPGTYTYQGEAAWRAYFRSTIGHNCLEIDGTDQSVSGGPFLWLKSARSELISASGLDGGPEAVWCAAFEGYGNVSSQARHQRTVRLTRGTGRILIQDHVRIAGKHECRLAFHLGPTVDCYLDGGVAQLSWDSGDGRRRATMRLPEGLSWTAVSGRSEPPLGWYSPCFGGKIPTTTLIGSGGFTGSIRLATELRVDLREKEVTAADADGGVAIQAR
jgi:hypothetical protein